MNKSGYMSGLEFLPVFLAIMMVIVSPLSAQPVITTTMSNSEFVGYVPDQIVVNFNSLTVLAIDKISAFQSGRTGIEHLDRLGRQLNVTSLIQRFPNAPVRYYQGHAIDLRGWFTVKFSSSLEAENCCDLYRQISGVLDAQPIGIHTVDIIPNDGFFSDQWHLDQVTDHDMDAPEAWDRQTGNPSIIVGVLDTGVRYYHKDLGGATASSTTPLNSRGNMWINTPELNAGIPNGVDNDGNGYVDDWIGWDFVTGISSGGGYFTISGEDYQTPDNNPSDFNGHGTHCAGNVSAINNNGYASSSPSGGWGDGTLQINANGVKVMALRIGYSLNYHSNEVGLVQMDFAASAFYYAANNGARIVSCSWGSSNDGGLGAAIDYFLAGGGLVFKAAGNSNDSFADYICGRSDANIISVAATDQSDLKAYFSSYGAWVDISAPGMNILSSGHDHTDPQYDYVAWMSGTSMATPLAASTAALIWSANPELTAEQVRTILFNNADDIDALNPSYAGLLGAGRVNAFSPLLDPTLPVELSSFTARFVSGQVILEWKTFSEVDNLGFEIYRSQSADSSYQPIASYQNQPALAGLGNSTIGQSYQYSDSDIRSGFLYHYILYDVDLHGQRTPHGPIQLDLRNGDNQQLVNGNMAENFILYPNYPNPFNNITVFSWQLAVSNKVELKIFNLLGQETRALISDDLPSGFHTAIWYGTDEQGRPLPSGHYFYIFQVGNSYKNGRITLQK